MRITDFLKKECIKVYVEGKNRESIIEELLDLIIQNYPAINKEVALAGLFKREKLESTAIGRGVAIPHARIENCDNISVAFGLLNKGVDFKSLDNKPVRVIILILFPKEKITLQMRFLARVARLLHHSGLHDKLFECSSQDDVLDSFKNYEDKHFH
jgi:mannitol/fructose-specific phosphotransferase system IIA component (Ntr-type)